MNNPIRGDYPVATPESPIRGAESPFPASLTTTRCGRHTFVTTSETLHANGHISRTAKCKVCGKIKHLPAVTL